VAQLLDCGCISGLHIQGTETDPLHLICAIPEFLKVETKATQDLSGGRRNIRNGNRRMFARIERIDQE